MNSKKKIFAMILTGAWLCGASPALAQYAEDALRFSQYGLNVGARSAGMGSVGVGVADDFSALFTNPAGLAQLRNFEFSVGLKRSSYNNDLTYYGTVTPGTTTGTSLSHIGMVYPVPTRRGSLTFAFGYGRMADYTSIASVDGTNPSSSVIASLIPGSIVQTLYDWLLVDASAAPGGYVPLVGGGVRQSITVLEDGGINHWSIGGAADFAKDLSLGVTLNFVSGSYSYDRQFVESDPNNLYTRYVPLTSTDYDEFRWESSIKSELSGFNALIGFMFRKQGRFRLGASIRTATNFEISETFTDVYELRTDTSGMYGPLTTDGTTKYKVVTPPVFSVGASITPVDWLMLAGDAEYTDWTQVQFDTNNPDLIQENRDIKTRFFRETWNLRGGAEVTLWDLGLRLRGGIVYTPSPYKADAAIKERDQLYYTAGAGVSIDEQTNIDVGYAYGTWKTLRDNYSISGIPRASRTDESIATHQLIATISYRF